MIVRKLVSALAVALFLAAPVRAQDALVTYKSLSPELALDLARAALGECRKRGYQAAVAVVDRFGVTQVMLRDRFAGAHTPATAAGKAWTAASFRTNTTDLVASTQPGMPQAGCAICRAPWSSAAASSSRLAARSSARSASRARRAAMPTTPAPRPASTRCATGSTSSRISRFRRLPNPL